VARIKCSLVLSGEALSPSEVSRRVGVVPTLVWKKGDFIGPSKRLRRDNGWKFSVEEANSNALEDVLRRLLHILEPKQAIFKSILDENGCEAEFACAIYLKDDSAVPSIHLDCGIVGILHAYNAELDIDMYPNPAGSEDPGDTERSCDTERL
jgi:hypothetical protein